MTSFRPRRPSAALVISVIALIAALGGTAYAGVVLGKNSVGTKQLKNGAVTTKKIKNGAVTAGKINSTGLTVPNALHATSADNATNATNATHATSATTATSATSATSATNATTAATATALASISYRQSATIASPACSANPCTAETASDVSGTAVCPAGTHVIGGGVHTPIQGLEINESQPAHSTSTSGPDEWVAFVDNFRQTAATFSVYAICVAANAVDNPSNVARKTLSLR